MTSQHSTTTEQYSINLERCIHQIFKPNEYYAKQQEGKGNCNNCTYNPQENKKCTGYQQIMVTYIIQGEP